jgi:hypothetical protein
MTLSLRPCDGLVRRAIAAVVSLVLVASLAGNWIVNGPPGPVAGLIAGGGALSAAARAPAAGTVPADQAPPQGGGQ